MNILELVRADGHELRRVGATNGGEYAGPCPFCGGNDRFRLWPEHKGGRYWCRGCHKTGDAIQYLRDSQGLSFREACRKLGVATMSREYRRQRLETKTPPFHPKTYPAPGEAWAAKANAFLESSKKALWSDRGEEARSFLLARGLSEETIHAAGLGWNGADLYRERASWGLERQMRRDGRPMPLWLPSGIVIPGYSGGTLVRLRVRRTKDQGPRYVVVKGSAVNPMLAGDKTQTVVVVESELDALLIHQDAGGMAGVCALGSVTIRPDALSHRTLTQAHYILIALDSDEPGARESWHFWANAYGGKAKRWPVPFGKDPTEARQAGLDLRLWIEAALVDKDSDHGGKP